MEKMLEIIYQTLKKSTLDNFKSYIALNNGVGQKFCIYSDYCLDDKDKSNNAISFTISPAPLAFPEFKEPISKVIPRDIKHTKDLTENATNFLNLKIFFHFNFILTDTDGLLWDVSRTPQQVLIQGIDTVILMIEKWIRNQPEGYEYFTQQIKKFKIWQQELKKRTANVKLAKQIIIVPALAGLIAFLLTKYARATDIIWFSDRDKIINSYNEIAYELFQIWHFGLCDQHQALEPYSNIGLAKPNISESILWFDHLVRVPDYLAGTLSSWDITTHKISKPKHAKIMQEVFADNNFCSVIDINFGRDSFKAGRHVIQK